MTKSLFNIILSSCLAISSIGIAPQIATAESCPDLRIVFARGSGGALNADENFLEFKSTIEQKLQTTSLDYEFIDLDYTAVGVGLDHLEVSLGALISGGDAYEFGASVDDGVTKMTNLVNSSSCPNTKYVLGGYSQGAMVVSKSIGSLNPDRIIYAATFGDPKLYLPEGKGIIPPACKNENLSDYRNYVPDCHAYEGLLGSYHPYEPEAFIGKMGTWCNKMDIFCSSFLSVDDHLAYTSDSLYEDASRVIFDKITQHYGIESKVTSPHDTAILIDSTGSMSDMIDDYKQEALRLAKETFESNGRVALYDYRDLSDPYQPVEHCSFETCTLETFQASLDKITANNGGDTPESLLSASFHVMNEQSWKYGSTKSLVVLTDANYLSPDRDSITLDQVVNLSKTIDPVNFYIITNSSYADSYTSLATATDGKVVSNFGEVSLLTDYIIERYDSLPRVEESEVEIIKPELKITSAVQSSENSFTFSIENTAEKALIILNEQILGITEQTTFTVSELDLGQENIFRFVPISDVRGETVEYYAKSQSQSISIKAPNTGAL